MRVTVAIIIVIVIVVIVWLTSSRDITGREPTQLPTYGLTFAP